MATNFVTIEGRLTSDGEVKEFGNFTKGSFTIAHNESWKNKSGEWQEKAHFFDVQMIGRNASKATSYQKGQLVQVTGKLQQDRWEKDGKSYSKVVLTAFSVAVLPATGSSTRATAEKPTQATGGGFTANSGGDDDLPF